MPRPDGDQKPHPWVEQQHANEISRTRNDLTLWALGRNPITLEEVQRLILKLDVDLQQVDL